MRDCRLVAAVECISDSCDSESSERVRNSARLRTLSLSGREDLYLSVCPKSGKQVQIRDREIDVY